MSARRKRSSRLTGPSVLRREEGPASTVPKAGRRSKATPPKKQGLISTLAAKHVPSHPEDANTKCPHYVEYRENGQHVDSATFATIRECEDWLMRLYNIEATDGTV